MLGIVDEIDDRGLESGKAHVIRMVRNMRDGENIFAVVSALRKYVNGLSSGIGQTEDSSCFVKALPCRIVARLAEDLHVRIVLHINKERVSARNGKAEKRRLKLRVGKIVGCNMPSNMMDRNQRNPKRHGGRLGKVDAHQNGADQPRCIGNRDSVDISPRDPCR